MLVLYERIKLTDPEAEEMLAGSYTNQYTVSLMPSSNAPIHLASPDKVEPWYWISVSTEFPLEFSTAPTSVPSVDPKRTFNASTYSPTGTKRSSTLLFILPAIKLVCISILLYPFIFPSHVHQESSRVHVT